ncbi:Papain inhibitor [Smittium culicis]|uniref:Papain inhibitor n=1 Tax=Smittium culicis TaxID=133412 RepID=A0A1R1YLI4_9FUNG|nr:Papain inhibitor [Smittium culicis]
MPKKKGKLGLKKGKEIGAIAKSKGGGSGQIGGDLGGVWIIDVLEQVAKALFGLSSKPMDSKGRAQVLPESSKENRENSTGSRPVYFMGKVETVDAGDGSGAARIVQLVTVQKQPAGVSDDQDEDVSEEPEISGSTDQGPVAAQGNDGEDMIINVDMNRENSETAKEPETAKVSETFKGSGTYYDPSVGAGSCGSVHKATELVAALNKDQFESTSNPNNSPSCGKCAVVRSKSEGSGEVKVRITDMCPGCMNGGLDLSPAAFKKIAREEKGRVEIEWEFVEC